MTVLFWKNKGGELSLLANCVIITTMTIMHVIAFVGKIVQVIASSNNNNSNYDDNCSSNYVNSILIFAYYQESHSFFLLVYMIGRLSKKSLPADCIKFIKSLECVHLMKI